LFKCILSVLLVATLSACGTTSVGLKYAAPPSVAQASARAQPLMVDNFADKRGEPATWLGAIRGGFGNPLKNLESDRPVSELVQAAFADGLRARGVTPNQPTSQFQITGIIKKLDCNQIVRREANVEIEVAVIDKAGKQRFIKTYSASNLDGSVVNMSSGVFGSVEDLRATLEKTLRETIDKALDDSAMRAALQI
jgi:uncharacterized lipoprotein YajG